MGVEDEVGRLARVATDKSRNKGIAEVPIAVCWYCGKRGHKKSECWKKRADSEKTGSGSGSGQTE